MLWLILYRTCFESEGNERAAVRVSSITNHQLRVCLIVQIMALMIGDRHLLPPYEPGFLGVAGPVRLCNGL